MKIQLALQVLFVSLFKLLNFNFMKDIAPHEIGLGA